MRRKLKIEVDWNPIAMVVMEKGNPLFQGECETFEPKHICNYQTAEVWLYENGLGWRLKEKSNFAEFDIFIKNDVLELGKMCDGMMSNIEDNTLFAENYDGYYD